jgi:hypothetical protein
MLNEISYVALPAHMQETVQLPLKTVSYEGHFIPEIEKVFLPGHIHHCTEVTETTHTEL